MNFKRISRVLICLVLVCALLVNISPVKARADVITGTLVVGGAAISVPAAIAICATLIALGIVADVAADNPVALQRLADDVCDAFTAAGTYVQNGMVEMYRFVTDTGEAVYYAPCDFMEAVRSHIYEVDCGVFSDESAFVAQYGASVANRIQNLRDSGYSNIFTFVTASGSVKFFYDSHPTCPGPRLNSNGYVSGNCLYGHTSKLDYVGCTYVDPLEYASSFRFSLADGKYYSITNGLTVENFLTVPIDGTSARTWSEAYANRGLYIASGGSQNPDDGGEGNDGWKFLLPLCLTTLLDLLAMSQADQWTADTPPEFSEYEEKQEYEVTPAPEFEGYPSIEIKPVTTPDVDPGGSGSGDDGSESGDGEGTDYTSWFEKLIKTLEEIPTKFTTWFTAIVSFVQQFPTMFEEWMAAFPSLFESWLSDLKNFALDFPSLFEEWLNNVIGAIQEAPAQIEQWINGLPDRFAGYFENVQLGFASVVDAVTGVGEYIVNGIRSAITDALSFLFEPEEGFIESKVQALSDEFTFVSSIITTGKALTTGLSGVTTSPPIIYVDLGASNGSYNYGGKTVFMDLSWYAEYKPTVDIIISAFLWICFIWRLILKLPGIINGMPGDFVMGSAHLFGLDNHLPSRNAAYEIQRAENRNSVRRGPPK